VRSAQAPSSTAQPGIEQNPRNHVLSVLFVTGAKHWPKGQAEKLSILKQFCYQLSMDVIFEPFWELNKLGFIHDRLKRGVGDYRRTLVVPYLGLLPVDLDEYASAASLVKAKGVMSHAKLMVPSSEYANHNVRRD